MEEAAEVTKEASKCLRFGCEDKGAGMETTNIERLRTELNDILAAISAITTRGGYTPQINPKRLMQMEHYMQYSIAKGITCDTTN